MSEDKKTSKLPIIIAVLVIAGLAVLFLPRLTGLFIQKKALPAFEKYSDSAQAIPAKTDIKLFSQGLEDYKKDNETYPTTSQGLAALTKKPTAPPVPKNWNGPYMTAINSHDPWGMDYVYIFPGKSDPKTFDLYSTGPNKTGDGNERDDIHH